MRWIAPSFDRCLDQQVEPYRIIDRITGEAVELPRRDYDDLCRVHLFDWLEQVPRSREWDYRRTAYRKMAERLGKTARETYMESSPRKKRQLHRSPRADPPRDSSESELMTSPTARVGRPAGLRLDRPDRRAAGSRGRSKAKVLGEYPIVSIVQVSIECSDRSDRSVRDTAVGRRQGGGEIENLRPVLGESDYAFRVCWEAMPPRSGCRPDRR